MTRKLLVTATAVALLGFGRAPLSAGQLPERRLAAGHIDESQELRNADIIDHQNRVQGLIAELEASLQAIVDAKDANGYVRDKSIVTAHEEDIVTLRNFVRNQRLFLIVYESKCGADSRQHDHIIQLQKQLRAALYDVVDTFDVYQSANHSSIATSQTVEQILDSHREALKELEASMTQHEQAMAQMMRKCS